MELFKSVSDYWFDGVFSYEKKHHVFSVDDVNETRYITIQDFTKNYSEEVMISRKNDKKKLEDAYSCNLILGNSRNEIVSQLINSHRLNKTDAYFKDTDFLSFNIDGNDCFGVSFVSIDRYVFSRGEDFFMSILNSSCENNNFNESQFNKIKEIYQKYNDVVNFSHELKLSSGYDYSNSLQQEFDEIYKELSLEIKSVYLNVDEIFLKSYFCYDESEIEDLSVVDGRRCYLWDGLNYSLFSSVQQFLCEFVIEHCEIVDESMVERLVDTILLDI